VPNEPVERWVWDARLARYRNLDSGRLLPAERIRQMRDRLLDAATAGMGVLAEALARGTHDVGSWERAMREAIKAIFGAQYVFGRGGLNAMQPNDWAGLGDLVEQQFSFLSGFADDVAAGKFSQPQIRIRAELYVGSSVQAHEAGKAAALDVELPAQPGDGSSECLANDRCAWDLRHRKDGTVAATWVADQDERTCKTCRKRAKDWNPLVLVPGATPLKPEPTSSKLRSPRRQQATV
jgi:hypothetical protein